MHETPTETRTGKIVAWHADRGYGFADDGLERTFIHLGDFAEKPRKLALGDTLTYTIGYDRRRRLCAKDIRQVSHHEGLEMIHVVVVLALLAAPGLAVWRRATPAVAEGIAAWALLSSILTFCLYVWDKRRAERGGRRVSETALHCWELLGGWPGALFAQRRVRHKSSKFFYQVVFWVIVGAYQFAALDWLLDWRLLGHLRRMIAGS
ncbi:MAG: DUF1294 domain-containing protein [Opitutales bacterium]